MKLSLLVITKNASEMLDRSLASVHGLVDEIVVMDDYSTDNTEQIARLHNARFFQNHQETFGQQRALCLEKCRGEWILMLDSDEILSKELFDEIMNVLSSEVQVDGYHIYFQNHLFGKPLHHGGEQYTKLVLFRKNSAHIVSNRIHEHIVLPHQKTGTLKNVIYHFSYRSIGQVIDKFTRYAVHEAKRKLSQGEQSNLIKIILYPPHMFFARFILDKGYRDGLFRIFLDTCFAYMEFLTYVLMLVYKKKHYKTNHIDPVNKT